MRATRVRTRAVFQPVGLRMANLLKRRTELEAEIAALDDGTTVTPSVRMRQHYLTSKRNALRWINAAIARREKEQEEARWP